MSTRDGSNAISVEKARETEIRIGKRARVRGERWNGEGEGGDGMGMKEENAGGRKCLYALLRVHRSDLWIRLQLRKILRQTYGQVHGDEAAAE